tara:strand:- start:319 stop:600 length:282 start_codon:yes stop_codon:yes gene_type:complete
MKVKLLRSTMISGVSKNSGETIVVPDHIGVMLVNISKAEEVTTEEPEIDDSPNFERMTKSELDTYGKNIGLELNLRQTKTQLITEIQTAISTS